MNPEIVSMLAAVAVTAVSPFVALLIALSLNVIEGALGLESSISLGRLFGAVVFGAAMVVTLYKRPRRGGVRARRAIVLSIVTFVVISIVGVVLSTDIRRGGVALMRLVALAGLPFLMLTFVTSRRRLRMLVWTLAAAYSVAAGLAILQYGAMRTGGPQAALDYGEVSGRGDAVRYSGAHGKPNSLAAVITTGVPFLVIAGVQAKSVWSKLAWTVILCVAGGGLLLAASRTFLVVSGTILGVFLILTRRRGGPRARSVSAWAATVLFVAFLAIVGLGDALPTFGLDRLTQTDLDTDSSAGYRFQTISSVWVALAASPLVGVGLDNFRYYSPVFGMGAHDTATALLGETGLGGTIAFLVLILNVVALAFRTHRAGIIERDPEAQTIRDAALASVLAALVGSFGFVLHWQRLWWLAIGLLFVLSVLGSHRFSPGFGPGRRPGGQAVGRPLPSGLGAGAGSEPSTGAGDIAVPAHPRGESGRTERSAEPSWPKSVARQGPLTREQVAASPYEGPTSVRLAKATFGARGQWQ